VTQPPGGGERIDRASSAMQSEAFMGTSDAHSPPNGEAARTKPLGRRPRLLFLVTEDWYFCSHRLALGRAAVSAGYDVAVATRVRDHGDIIRQAGIRLIPLPWSRRSANVWNELRTFAALLKIYRRERPEVVHHVALKPVLYGSLVARLTGTRRVINAVAGFGYTSAADGTRARVARRILRKSFGSMSNRAGTRVLVQNPDDERALRDSHTVRPEHLVVIPGSGVDVNRFAPSPDGEPVGVPRVTLVSRMLWSKGVGDFVKSAKLLREKGVEFEAVLVGSPDPENPQSISEETLRRWRHEGVVNWWGHCDDVPSVWRGSHVAVLPTYYGEGLPKTLLEAAACGLPLVATDAPGCREIVVDGHNGLLVPAKDPESLAMAIERLVSDPDVRRGMGRAARAVAVEQFSEEIVIDRVLALYRSLMEES
jgi:glycosyltransferase involved in cell wall biosynthesis